MARGKIEEVYSGRVELDVEAILNTLKNRSFVDIVIAGVDNTYGFGPALLSCSDGRPEDSLAASASITMF